MGGCHGACPFTLDPLGKQASPTLKSVHQKRFIYKVLCSFGSRPPQAFRKLQCATGGGAAKGWQKEAKPTQHLW